MLKPVNAFPNFPLQEEEILKFWKKNGIFEKSIESKPQDKYWTFLDGPPFITGQPHYGTLLSSIPKDLFPRFWTMKGYRVRRVWGWDCHGLPAENKVENKLGIKRKKDIEDVVGVKKFIDECKLYVSEVSSEWEWYVDHIARWVDFKNAYKTMDKDYMESVMWVFKQMYDKGLIYKGLRISLFCPHCSTPISNFEVAMDSENYKTLTEPANTYKYELKNEKGTFILAWSTTPWNKIVTPALAINPKLTYVKVQEGEEKYILAETTLKILKTKDYKILEKFKGKDLLGTEFIPHYNFYKIEEGKKAFIVIGGDFVTADEGTGVVTIAAYGEDDLNVMKKENIQIMMHVDEEGKIKPEVTNWAGMYYLKVNPLVNKDLEDRNLMYKEEQHTHNIPTCWRCHTRLIYAPQDAWYVDVQSIKPKLLEKNEKVNWFPKHFKKGRFAKSIEAAPDWCISRSRYWGSPVPVWECLCGERFVPESIDELEKKSGKKINDLHKPDIDDVTITCEKCGAVVHRVKEVLDSWIEAGSASYAERHFPFDSNQKLENFFPPDFITEYTGQIRAWFYVLHVIAASIFDQNAFKNVVVNGVVLGTDGRKMSKNFGNYPDPKEMIQKYGGDALRLYLMGSSVMHGEDVAISEEEYKTQIKDFLLPLWNVYNFFLMYSNNQNWKPNSNTSFTSNNVLDKWIMSLLNNLIKEVTHELENYNTVSYVSKIKKFVDDFSKWYIRRSRDRIGTEFFETCYLVLKTFSQIIAPITPFISEIIFKNLSNDESVHLTSWPEENKKLINNNLEREMVLIRKITEIGHAQRKQNNIKVRMPIGKMILNIDEKEINVSDEVWEVALLELNVKNIQVNDVSYPKIEVKFTEEELINEGKARDIIRKVQEERKKAGLVPEDVIILTIPEIPKGFKELIAKKTISKEIKIGPVITVEKV